MRFTAWRRLCFSGRGRMYSSVARKGLDVCKEYCYWSLERGWPVKKQLTHGREEMIKR
jgi:hypothetical protein